MSRTGGVLAAVMVAALLLLPAVAAAAPAPDGDAIRTLAGDSPLCSTASTAAARTNCEQSGTVEHAYPLDHYRFDWHIDTGITHIASNLAAGLQWITSFIWEGVLLLANAILMVFQWAFSLDLLGSAMRPVKETLDRIHTTVFGEPWLLAAVTLLGGWGLWNGMVRRRVMATAGSMVAALLMMAGALAIIAQPDATVGAATRAVNSAKIGILAGVTQGSARNPQGALDSTSQEIFDTVVLRPWCAVQFGDVKWCLAKTAGAGVTHADRFLMFAPGSKARDFEYKLLADDSTNALDMVDATDGLTGLQKALLLDPGYQKSITKTDRTKVKMQEQDNTVLRAGLVLLVVLGILGWAALLGWLAVQSLLQGLLGLVLILAAPIMLLAPAFGDAGRRAFMRWATRLLATVVSGAIYALLLALTLTVAQVLGELSVSSTWLIAWLLQMLFLWGVFFKRKLALEWLSGGTHQAGSMRMTELQAGMATARQARSKLTAPVAAIGGAATGVLIGSAVRGRSLQSARQADQDQAVQLLSSEQVADRGRQQLQTKYDAYHARLTTHDEAQRKLPEMRRRRDKIDRELSDTRTSQERRAELNAQRGKLTGQIKSLEPTLMPRSEEGVARKFIETADRNLVESGHRFSAGQVGVAVEGLRQDLVTPGGADASHHAWRTQAYHPGVPESELAKLPDEQRLELHRNIAQDIERDRALFASLPADPREQRAPAKRRKDAAKHFDKPVLSAARREQRAQRLAQTDGGVLHNVNSRVADKRARRSAARAPAGSTTTTPPSAVGSTPPPRHRR